ncbi:GTPase IMAP family member 4, partial [Nibea albiflora]
DELRIVLVGKTGGGKTSIRNFLLEEKVSGWIPPTTKCGIYRGECGGQKLAVIDTPGVFNINMTKKEVLPEIAKCMILAQPGPHVFLYVADAMTFTQEDQESMKIIQDVFGSNYKDHTLAVFLSGTKPDGDPNIELGFRGGYYLCDTNDKSSKARSELLEKIMELVRKNKGEHYTYEAFEEAKKVVEKEKAKKKTDSVSDDMIEALINAFMGDTYAR